MVVEFSLDHTFAALADPTRRAILARLLDGEASVAELAQPFELTVRAVSKHVGVLEQAGLITRSRAAQKHLSRIEPKPLRDIDRWLDDYRKLWEGRFDRMEDLLRRDADKAP
ncbi:metalloregulator ArsR/SmtB family transcription factor [Mesorhizobium australicum]|uniref:Metalloregulator ArsR/SmtB family transcription factor n=1 Tax=Mesorhizobium australicum TaxID=536018 RepID=A0ACC6SXX0_9HYPH